MGALDDAAEEFRKQQRVAEESRKQQVIADSLRREREESERRRMAESAAHLKRERDTVETLRREQEAGDRFLMEQSALEVRAHQDFMSSLMPRFEMPLSTMPDPSAFTQHLASGFYERLKTWIIEFESSIDEEHEVGVRLVSFGQAVTFHLLDIRYWNPLLIRFDGVSEDGLPLQLIQNVNQISMLLMKVPKQGPTPRRVGFHASSDDAEPDS